ncbi:MAG TPA: GAP family protein [Solirubrobacteraceae bacterium]
MLGQLIPLAVLSAITSPTAIAAVLVILSRPNPRTLMTAYVVGSFIASVSIGIGLVALLKSSHVFTQRQTSSRPTFEIVVGVIILISELWLSSARSEAVRRRSSEWLAARRQRKAERSGGKPSRSARILGKGSVGLVAALGVAMHLPGLLYLVALSEIAGAHLGRAETVLVLIAFNLVMLAPIELPWLGCILDPKETQRRVTSIDDFIRRHQRREALIAGAVAGGYLVISGIAGLV